MEKKRREDFSQRESEEISKVRHYYENILAKMPGHIFWKNKEGVFLGCNDQQAKTLGLSSWREVIGKTTFDMVWHGQSEEDRHRQAAIIDENDRIIMETGNSQVLEEPLILPDGNVAIYLSKKAPLYNDRGEVIGILGISFDITEKKKLEEELQETKHKLDGMMLVSATIAHELRTPLASFGISVDAFKKIFPHLKQAYSKAIEAKLVSEDIDLDYLGKMGEILVSMKSEIRAAFTFIDISLMNTTSIQHGKKEIFPIGQCVDEALDRYPFDLGQRERVIWKNKTNQDFSVKSDKLLLMHVLFNLLKNALYYTANKGDIQIWLEKGSAYNMLYFKDTGEGISPDILSHIFERFFTRTYHGAGVGLTFCKNVMESIGGNITCESVEGSYTLFMLTFPIHLKE